VLDHRGVAIRRALLGIRGATHHADDQRDRGVRRLGESVVPALDQMTSQRGEQRILHAVVMSLCDTVFAVVAAQLGEERHRLSARWAINSENNHVIALANAARCAAMPGGNRSRTEMSMANQRV